MRSRSLHPRHHYNYLIVEIVYDWSSALGTAIEGDSLRRTESVVRDEPRYLETDDEEKKPSTRLHASPTLIE